MAALVFGWLLPSPSEDSSNQKKSRTVGLGKSEHLVPRCPSGPSVSQVGTAPATATASGCAAPGAAPPAASWFSSHLGE